MKLSDYINQANPAVNALRYHVTGAIERGEKQAIVNRPPLKVRRRLSLLRLNLASRIRFDRWMRLHVGRFTAENKSFAIFDKNAGYRRVTLEELNDEG